ncbi:MAG: chemotaxis response regulator protein-glutamate methylesterase [Peptococcaceae bacterium]|jgi:two-component system chemotaxis response regulator CheB|nr:chemotaxis response regulator protein-glutamate methylesterase [Peptococcaceae bacterium]
MKSLSKQHKIKVLIADDSPFMRMTLQRILEQDPDIEVVDVAHDGLEAIEKIQRLSPQVVILDVEMPKMTGLQVLDEVMRWQPTPVIIMSASAAKEGQLTLQALELGAVDAVVNPSLGRGVALTDSARDLIEKVKAASGADPRRIRSAAPSGEETKVKISGKRLKETSVPQDRVELVAIGSSTGGPPALQTVFINLPQNFPVPIIVAQHMPPGFTALLAQRLDKICQLKIKEAAQGDILQAGTVYIAPAGKQMQVQRRQRQLTLQIDDEALIPTVYHPSVDVMFSSVAKEIGSGALCAILTGMGSDGMKGMKEVKARKGFAVAEAEESCVVYGMPRAVIEAGLADRVAPLPEIGKIILECVMRR